jgi:hypothetical protein
MIMMFFIVALITRKLFSLSLAVALLPRPDPIKPFLVVIVTVLIVLLVVS